MSGLSLGFTYRPRQLEFILLGCLSFSAAPVQAQMAPCVRMDSVSALAKALERAWNAGDAERWSSFYTLNADFVNIAGLHFSGREAIKQRHAAVFSDQYRGSRLELRNREVYPLGRAHALLETDAALSPAPTDAAARQSEPVRTRFTFVLARDVRCGWMVRLSQNTLIVQASASAK